MYLYCTVAYKYFSPVMTSWSSSPWARSRNVNGGTAGEKMSGLYAALEGSWIKRRTIQWGSTQDDQMKGQLYTAEKLLTEKILDT